MKVLIESITCVDETDLQKKPQEITQARWERIMQIRPLEDKKRSLLAGKLLHRMCQECGITDPVYGTVKSGKPVLVGHSEIAFSISHSGEYVVVVYTSKTAAVGVDIQQLKSMSEGLKKRFLHEEERLWMENQIAVLLSKENAEKQNDNELPVEMRYLNRIWAIKESFVKMTGEGLAHDFRNLCVNLEEKTVTDENGKRVAFIEPEAPEGYVMAVVLEN